MCSLDVTITCMATRSLRPQAGCCCVQVPPSGPFTEKWTEIGEGWGRVPHPPVPLPAAIRRRSPVLCCGNLVTTLPLNLSPARQSLANLGSC